MACRTWTRTLAEQGFIHASTAEQVAPVANMIYKGLPDLLVLVIDTDLVGPEIKWEPMPGWDAPFPHIYGPLNADAVVDTRPFEPGPDGEFSFDTVLRDTFREHGHGGAAPPASDRIVSINLVRTAAKTPRLVGHPAQKGHQPEPLNPDPATRASLPPPPGMIRSRAAASRAPAAPLRGRYAPLDPPARSQNPAAIRDREPDSATPRPWPPAEQSPPTPLAVTGGCR